MKDDYLLVEQRGNLIMKWTEKAMKIGGDQS